MALVQSILDQAAYYRKLKIELDSEENVESELAQVRTYRQELEGQIRSKRAEIVALEENSKKEYRDVRDLRHLSIRSAAATLSGKKKEKTAKKEAKYQLAFENEQRSKRELNKLEASYEASVIKEETLSRQKDQFKDSRRKLESLLERIFSAEDPDFPSEPRLKSELINYKEQKRLAKRDKERFQDAENALSKALVDIKKAIRLIDEVVHYVPFELFAGPVIDEEQVAYLEAARKRTWEVQRLLNKARTVLPEIPYPQTLDVVTNNPLLQMQLNANYIDSAWRAKTTQCFGLLASVYRNTQSSINWVKQYKDYAQGALLRLERAVEDVKKSLVAERQRIIDTVLYNYNSASQSGAAAAAAESSSHMTAPIPDILSSSYQSEHNDFPPPPMYEAPIVSSDQQDQVIQHQQFDDGELGQGQGQHLPVVPPDMTPLSSFSNLSDNGAATPSPLIPVTSSRNHNDTSNNTPTFDTIVNTPFTPNSTISTNQSNTTTTTSANRTADDIFSHTDSSQHPPSYPPPPPPLTHTINTDSLLMNSDNTDSGEHYVSHNVNNPFRSQSVTRQ